MMYFRQYRKSDCKIYCGNNLPQKDVTLYDDSRIDFFLCIIRMKFICKFAFLKNVSFILHVSIKDTAIRVLTNSRKRK